MSVIDYFINLLQYTFLSILGVVIIIGIVKVIWSYGLRLFYRLTR